MPEVRCPFCNGVLNPEQLRPVQGRINCPKCEQQLPSSVLDELTQIAPKDWLTVTDNRKPGVIEAHRHARAMHSIKRTLLLGLALGALGMSVGYARNYFRAKPIVEQPPVVKSVEPLSPLEIRLIDGFLTADQEVIAIVQMEPIRQFFEDKGTTQKDGLNSFGFTEEWQNAPEKLTGIALQDLSMISGAMDADDLLSKSKLYLASSKPVDLSKLAEKGKSIAAKSPLGNSYMRFTPTSAPVEFVVYQSDPNSLIVGLDAKAFDAMKKAADRFSTEMTHLIQTRLPGDSVAWIIADLSKFKTLPMVQVPKQLKRLAISLQLKEQPILGAWVECDSEETAAKFRKEWIEKLVNAGGTIQIGGAKEWIYLRTEFDAEQVRFLIRQLTKDEKKKQ
jgi:hypothetical protein